MKSVICNILTSVIVRNSRSGQLWLDLIIFFYFGMLSNEADPKTNIDLFISN